MVCLSAILPSGDELDDLTAWIRSDEPGEPVRSDWRPTRQRFGALTWRAAPDDDEHYVYAIAL